MFIHALHVVMAIIATWRITELFLQDRITEKLRKKFPTYILNCPRCFSIWASIVAVVALYFFPWFNWPFALGWLYLWHMDSAYRRQQQRDGRSLIVRMRPEGGYIERMELTPQELVGLMNSLVPPPKPEEK